MLSTITLPRTLRVGGGSIAGIGELIWGMGLRKPLVVTDAFMVSNGSADKLVSSLLRAGLVPSLFSETVPDPTTDSLAPGVLLGQDHEADCVICASDSDADRLAADKLVHRLALLASDLSVPTPQSHGIDEAQWKKLTPLMAQEALSSGSPGNNPVIPGVMEVAQLFKQVYA